MPPWPLGLTARRSGASSRSRPVAASTAGIVPWQKTCRSSSASPKRSCAARNAERLLVRRRTGHQVKRYPHAVPLGRRPGSSRRGSGTAVRPETGPIGNMPLGWSNPSRVPCPPATSITPTSPAASASAPRRRASAGREPVRGRVQPEGRRRPGALGQRAEIALLVPLAVQPLQQVQVQRADRAAKRLLPGRGQLIPESQQVLLAVAGQQGLDFFLLHNGFIKTFLVDRSQRALGGPSSPGPRRLAAR